MAPAKPNPHNAVFCSTKLQVVLVVGMLPPL